MNQSDEAKKLMDLKQKRIANFQDAKERSMAIMSSGRDAALMVSTMGQLNSQNMEWRKEKIKEWRKFFFYEIYGTDPDEEVKQQLKETAKPSEILGF